MKAWHKIITITWNEFRQFVLTKTFILLVLLSPVLIGMILVLSLVAESNRDLSDRHILVVDHTGQLFSALVKEAEDYNQYDIYQGGELATQLQVRSRFYPKTFDASSYDSDSQLKAALSQRVREGEVDGFLVIEETALSPDPPEDAVQFFTQNQTYLALPQWLEATISRLIQNHRLEAAGIDPGEVRKLTTPVPFARYGLAEVSESGDVVDPQRENPLVTYMLPVGALMILFFCANMSSPIMLNSIMEEKMQKIVEVLLASVTPIQLMTGKLLGSMLVAGTLAVVYLAPSLAFLVWRGLLGEIPAEFFFWFPVFLLITLLSLGSVWAAIGAACAELKDTQNFAGIAVLLLILPLLLATVILESPHAPFAVVTSMLPACYPFLMTIRLMTEPGPEAWHLWAGLGINLIFVVLAILAGAKIFRRGILGQGTTPSLKSLAGWLMEKD